MRHWIVEAMETVRQRHDVALWAYVIMPEHVHVLLCPRRDGYDISRILYDLKRPVSYKAKRHLVETGRQTWLDRLTVVKGGRRVFRLWMRGGGFDRNVFHTRSLQTIIDYVHANPVRRGLTVSPEDWQWSSARFWGGCQDVPIRMNPLPV